MENSSESPIITRLKQFMASTGLTSTQFADKAGIPRPSMSQLLHGRNKSINNQILAKLDEQFPMLNTLWLLFGRGDMYQNSNIETSEAQNAPSSAGFPSQEPDSMIANSSEMPEYGRRDNPQTKRISEIFSEGGPDAVRNEPSVSSGGWTTSVLCTPPDDQTGANRRRITSIIVFYSDNSFDTFLPSDAK